MLFSRSCRRQRCFIRGLELRCLIGINFVVPGFSASGDGSEDSPEGNFHLIRRPFRSIMSPGDFVLYGVTNYYLTSCSEPTVQ